MKKYWEQLKPGERRVVAGVGLAIFLLINWWMVWPHFHDWRKAEGRMKKAHDLMTQYSAEIRNRPTYDAKIRQLQSDTGSEVMEEDQAIDLIRFYNSRANSNAVQIVSNSRLLTRTNDPFFVDQEMQLTIQGRENHLVNFLYSLGAGNSIVRVRAMSLRPDASHQQINANISIVASYAKRAPVRPASSAAPAAPATPKTEAPAPHAAVQTNKPLVTATHSNPSTNKPVPLTAKRP